MDIETTQAIKFFFPKPSLVQVYFEALANALDAGANNVSIAIKINAFDDPQSLRVTITDNGSGFTNENFNRFKTLLKPRSNFHKGLGRLIFLHYFNRVKIESVWGNISRDFIFKVGFDGDAPTKELQNCEPNSTKLTFEDFAGNRFKSYDDLKPEPLKDKILEHLLPTLYELSDQQVDFKIQISLDTDKDNSQKDFFSRTATITQNDLPKMNAVSIKENSIHMFEPINILYHVKEDTGKGYQLIAFDVDGRTIPVKLVNRLSIPIGYSIVFIFSSNIFRNSSDSSRQKLLLPEGIQEGQIHRFLRQEIAKILAERIPRIVERNTETKRHFEEVFPHLLGYFDEEVVGLIDKDEALTAAQGKFFQAQKEILQCDVLDDKSYEKSIEISSRTLTEYILYRDKIIRRMKAMTENNSEADIHNLIVPRYAEYGQDNLISDIYRNNAWLLDDKFMVFQTILSESRMDKVINAILLDDETRDESGRPDIAMIFSADPEDEKSVDVVVVEIKKKTNDEKENQYAINQLLDRAVKLAEYCPNIQRIWYYAAIQISDTMSTRLRQQKWAPLFSMGRVFYQEFPTERPNGTIVPTPTFVMSFDAIVADAECRNHTFLNILRNEMKSHAEKAKRLLSAVV